jgi:hypothetical protein
MNREIHVRFWESLGVRFPWATHCALHMRNLMCFAAERKSLSELSKTRSCLRQS